MRTDKKIAALVGLTLAVAAAGCASTGRAYYFPSRTRAQVVTVTPGATAAPIVTRQFIPEDQLAQELRIACEARAYDDEPVAGLKIPTVRVRIWIYNYSRRDVELRPKEFSLVDDVGRQFTPIRALLEGRETDVVLATAPTRSALDLVFQMPDGYDVRANSSLHLEWGFRIGGKEVRHDTVFERSRHDRPFRDPFFLLGPRT